MCTPVITRAQFFSRNIDFYRLDVLVLGKTPLAALVLHFRSECMVSSQSVCAREFVAERLSGLVG